MRNFLFARLFCAEQEPNILGFVKTPEEPIAYEREPDGDAQVKKELIDKLLEVSRRAAREVRVAVLRCEGPLHSVIAGVIMPFLDEVES